MWRKSNNAVTLQLHHHNKAKILGRRKTDKENEKAGSTGNNYNRFTIAKSSYQLRKVRVSFCITHTNVGTSHALNPHADGISHSYAWSYVSLWGYKLVELLCNVIFQMDSVSLIPGLRETQDFAFIHVLLSQLSIAINTSKPARGGALEYQNIGWGRTSIFREIE